jgi:hypothetical protein
MHAEGGLRTAADVGKREGRDIMRSHIHSPILSGGLAGAVLLAAACGVGAWRAQAQEMAIYPDWKGEWVRIGGGAQYDPTKPPTRGQQPPITEEYRAIWEKNIAEGVQGGQYFNTQVRCLPGGMPRMMMAYEPMEVIITRDATYVHITFNNEFRRIFTDGREFPTDEEPSFSGYSIGKWIDEDGDGRYDVLVVETRNLKGPRIFDPSGIPFHEDNQTVIKERIYSDKTNPNKLYDEITTFDHALTRPWTVTRSYDRARKTVWVEHICAENNDYVFIRGDTYNLNPQGYLAPSRPGQAPPDLRMFGEQKK